MTPFRFAAAGTAALQCGVWRRMGRAGGRHSVTPCLFRRQGLPPSKARRAGTLVPRRQGLPPSRARRGGTLAPWRQGLPPSRAVCGVVWNTRWRASLCDAAGGTAFPAAAGTAALQGGVRRRVGRAGGRHSVTPCRYRRRGLPPSKVRRAGRRFLRRQGLLLSRRVRQLWALPRRLAGCVTVGKKNAEGRDSVVRPLGVVWVRPAWPGLTKIVRRWPVLRPPGAGRAAARRLPSPCGFWPRLCSESVEPVPWSRR